MGVGPRVNLGLADLEALALKVLLAGGLAPHQAQPIARSVALTEAAGSPSHGLYRIKGYVASVRSGRVSGAAQPQLHRVASGVVRVDGQNGFAPATHALGAPVLIEAAKAHGIAALALTNCYHFSSLWHDLTPLVDAGLTCWAFTIGQCIVAPHGGKERLMGTNPIAFAAPAGRNLPFVLDMATTTTAAGKVKVYDLNERAMPAGWVVDGAGNPITDAKRGMKILHEEPEGGLSPLGGSPEMASHKGYGLAMMVHILGGTLVGSSFSPIRNRMQKPNDPDDIGHFFMAIDPGAFRAPGEFEADLDAVIDELHATPAADPAKPVLVAGDPEEAERQRRLKHGIPVPPALDKHIRDICARSGAAYLLS